MSLLESQTYDVLHIALTVLSFIFLVSFILIYVIFSRKKKEYQTIKNEYKEFKDRFNYICEAFPEMFIIVDKNYNVIFTNKTIRKFFGINNNDNISGFKDNTNNALSTLYKLVEKGLSSQVELCSRKVVHVNGEEYYLQITSRLMDQGVLCLLYDITNLEKTKQKLHDSNLNYQNLIEFIPAMICETNEKGIVTIASRRALERFGYTKQDVKNGISLLSLLSDSDQDRAKANLEKVIRQENMAIRRYTAKTKSGEHFPALVNAIPVFENDKLVGFRGVMLDITEQLAIEQELATEKDRAEALSKAKSDFMANFSHEIRTPINIITGLSDALQKSQQDSVVKHQLKTIYKSANVLLSLINNILDLSKIEAGKAELYLEMVNIGELLQDMYETFNFSANEKGIKLVFHYPDNLPLYLLLDTVKFRQILFNLVGNAIKFTEEGSVEVFIQTIKEDDKFDLKVVVRDTGYGIPASQQKSIFESFNQSTPFDKKNVGSGLGLTITKKIVEMMNGTIRLKSKIFKGSEFTVIIPNIKVNNETIVADKTNLNEADNLDFTGVSAVIIDDVEANILTLEQHLSLYNFNITSFSSAVEALKHIDSVKTQIIFMDLLLPHLSGIEATKILKQQESTKHIPVIAYSANIKQLAEKDKELFVSFLIKPIRSSSIKEILSKVKNSLNLSLNFQSEDSGELTPELEFDTKKELTNKCYNKWKNVQKYYVKSELEEFCDLIKQVSENRNNSFLEDYASTLYNYIQTYQIDEVEKELKRFKGFMISEN